MGSDKWWKVFSYKTGRGKLNILTDIIFHGLGRIGAIFDEMFHVLIEGGFNLTKFFRYGNAFRIFKGCGCMILLIFSAAGTAGILCGIFVGAM